MRIRLVLLLAASFAFGPACAKSPGVAPQSAKACLAKAGGGHEDLSPNAKRARDRLVRNPSEIDVVVAEAGDASARDRLETELGIVRAVRYLKCVDPSGDQAIEAYLKAHPDNAVVAEIVSALDSLASTGDPVAGASYGGSAGGGGGGSAGGGGGFAASGAQISTH